MSTEELKHFKAKCHCGKIAVEFDHAPFEESPPMECNCSICLNKGYLFVYVLRKVSAIVMYDDSPAYFLPVSQRI
jgi:hypothetical protein